MVHLKIEERLNAGTIISKNGNITRYREQTVVPDEMLLFFKDPISPVNNNDLMFWYHKKNEDPCFCVIGRSDDVDLKHHKFLGHIDNVRCSGGNLQLRLFLRHSY